MDEDKLALALKGIPVSSVSSFDTIGSTNDEALARLENGCADGSLFIADEQTRGRGRFDRKWVTHPGSSLAFTLVARPTPQEAEHLQLFAPLCGLAVRQALQDLYKLDALIKWPNDVLIGRRKCAGILVEAAWSEAELRGIVLGIGINIAEGSVPPSSNQLFPATYVEAATGHPVDRFEVLREVLHSLFAWRARLGSREFFETWGEHLAFLGESVKIVQSPKPSIIGVVKGIDHQGRLILVQENSVETAVEVGDVHLRLADESIP